ncbi:MAG TPA: hypothetical protein DDW52_25035 [Planctomycetaceae bacterium]|nr:hypothetical protein [Planctomycetaceae bacterium]
MLMQPGLIQPASIVAIWRIGPLKTSIMAAGESSALVRCRSPIAIYLAEVTALRDFQLRP